MEKITMKKTDTDSLLSALRDNVREKEKLIEKIIKENLMLKELLMKKEAKP